MSSSALPYSRTPPAWCKTDASEVSEQIFKYAKKGMTPSQIGVVLRDSHGIPQVKFITGESSFAEPLPIETETDIYLGNKILRILKSSGNHQSPPLLRSFG